MQVGDLVKWRYAPGAHENWVIGLIIKRVAIRAASPHFCVLVKGDCILISRNSLELVS